MYNALFENIIQANNKYTDELEDSASEANFYARISENLLFEQVLKKAHLQEMSILRIEVGIKYIINLIKSGVKSIKNQFSHWLLQGGDEGVLFYDQNNNPISAEEWFGIVINEAKNKNVDDTGYQNFTYIQIPAYKERIRIIETQYPLIIQFARDQGWVEGKKYTQKDRIELEKKIINELDLSSISETETK